jgi:hypothetical protein
MLDLTVIYDTTSLLKGTPLGSEFPVEDLAQSPIIPTLFNGCFITCLISCGKWPKPAAALSDYWVLFPGFGRVGNDEWRF